MTIELDAEQRAFRDGAGQLAADVAGNWRLGRGPADVSSPEPSAADWSRMAEAGWFGLRLREENGGMGADAVYAGLLVEQVARHALAAPVAGTLIAAEQLQAHGADPDVLSAVAAGELRIAPLLRPDLTEFAAGGEALAWDSAGADFAVSVDDGATHLLAEPDGGIDLTRSVRVPLAEPPASPPGVSCRPLSQADRARVGAFALAMLTADLLGTMEAAHAAAVDYAKTRRQFGAPIGSFEAIGDIAAEQLVLVEATRSAMWYATWSVDALAPADALRAARMAKAFAARAAVEVCESAVQVFGGIGFTWEFPAHVWLRRAHASRRVFGDEHHQEAILAARIFEVA
ncbi:MAG TPA: acyl-CoA dehydrogenase family protein [Trebonia sp.]|jgi:alkylation response protein AidB-like acyl-CoA dehydrogenase|nr:acyl-CoA dehydrogenase family protein [Trebonia sp.]